MLGPKHHHHRRHRQHQHPPAAALACCPFLWLSLLLLLASGGAHSAPPPTPPTTNSLNGTATPPTTTTADPTTTTTTTTTTTAAAAANVTRQHEQGPNSNNGELYVPRSERQQVLEMFRRFFLKPRSHDDQPQKELVREGLVLRLQDLGHHKSFLQRSRFEFRHRPANSYNIINILPGRHHRSPRDQILLVGAHWDTATKAPGVDDNGSGSVCLLEIARLLAEHKCRLNYTIMLVWFDYEEQGKFGSEFFVNDYLFPMELDKYGSRLAGAYILDMILVRDKENNTQALPQNLVNTLGAFSEELAEEKYRGDFLATWARKTWDEPLELAFRESWLALGFENRTFKAMRPELPQTKLPNAEERHRWKDFFRSDHASFWFPQITSGAVKKAMNRSNVAHSANTSLSAILLTDLGPWRKSYQKCYHSPCDDEHLLTDGNLSFMQQVIDSLMLTLLRQGQGRCQPPPSSPSNQTKF